jgi:hypothetical protein
MDQPSDLRSTQVFDVFLRLRPSPIGNADTERYLHVEPTADPDKTPQFVTIQPPTNDHRKRAVEQFAFTKIFQESASQLDLFDGTGVLSLIDGILGADGKSRDGLLATLGVTGSGKVTYQPKITFPHFLCSSNYKLESHNPRIKIPTRSHTTLSRLLVPKHIPQHRPPNMRQLCLPVPRCLGRLRIPNASRTRLPRLHLRRRPIHSWQLFSSPDPNACMLLRRSLLTHQLRNTASDYVF